MQKQKYTLRRIQDKSKYQQNDFSKQALVVEYPQEENNENLGKYSMDKHDLKCMLLNKPTKIKSALSTNHMVAAFIFLYFYHTLRTVLYLELFCHFLIFFIHSLLATFIFVPFVFTVKANLNTTFIALQLFFSNFCFYYIVAVYSYAPLNIFVCILYLFWVFTNDWKGLNLALKFS